MISQLPPLPNSGAESGLASWDSENVELASTERPNGQHCFKLIPSGSSATLRSGRIPVCPGEHFVLSYELKTPVPNRSDDSVGTVEIRSFDATGAVAIEPMRFELISTDQWQEFRHEFSVDQRTFDIELLFSVPPEMMADSNQPVLLDSISLYREIRLSSLVESIRPLSRGDSLYVFKVESQGGVRGEMIAMQTLQGVLARIDRPRLWMDVGDDTFINYLKQEFDIHFDQSLADDFAGLLGNLRNFTDSKYVLYDLNDKPSISAATTMAGVLGAVAIDIGLENIALNRGFTLALDVRGKDCRWVYEKYRSELNQNGLIVHTSDRGHHASAAYLRDWGPATKSLDWWYNDEPLSNQVYRSMSPASPVFGWQDPASNDEGAAIGMHSAAGLYQIPCDWMLNLSVHGSLGSLYQDRSIKQSRPSRTTSTEDNVHYVTFVLSDMDNILTEIGTRSFHSSKKYFASPHKGKFAMTWGMAPSLIDLSPAGVEMWYRGASINDAFIAYCGPGYFFPSLAPYLQTHRERLSDFLKRADLSTMLIIDKLHPNQKLTEQYYEYAKWFTSIEELRGLFYLDYAEYAPHGGRIFWFDGKPMVTARFDFRDNEFYSAVRSTPQSLADSINELPTDIASPDSYTFVTVHAWSRDMDDILATIQFLDDDVRVVNAEEFVELLHTNLTVVADQSD